MQGSCAKQVVTCTLVHPDGRRWVGRNDVRNPQAVCPRGNMPSGMGYGLCTNVCGQDGHAEEQALRLAGADAKGCTAYVEGIHYICMNCQGALMDAGVRSWVMGAPSFAHTCTPADERALFDRALALSFPDMPERKDALAENAKVIAFAMFQAGIGAAQRATARSTTTTRITEMTTTHTQPAGCDLGKLSDAEMDALHDAVDEAFARAAQGAAQGAGTAPVEAADRSEVRQAVRRVLKHHKLTVHGDGVVEADLAHAVMDAVALLSAPVSTAAAPEKTILHLRWRQEHAEWRECMSDCPGAVEFIGIVPAGYEGIAPSRAADGQQGASRAVNEVRK